MGKPAFPSTRPERPARTTRTDVTWNKVSQASVYNAIVGLWLNHGRCPTTREIAYHCGVRHCTTILPYITGLYRAGLIDVEWIGDRMKTMWPKGLREVIRRYAAEARLLDT